MRFELFGVDDIVSGAAFDDDRPARADGVVAWSASCKVSGAMAPSIIRFLEPISTSSTVRPPEPVLTATWTLSSDADMPLTTTACLEIASYWEQALTRSSRCRIFCCVLCSIADLPNVPLKTEMEWSSSSIVRALSCSSETVFSISSSHECNALPARPTALVMLTGSLKAVRFAPKSCWDTCNSRANFIQTAIQFSIFDLSANKSRC